MPNLQIGKLWLYPTNALKVQNVILTLRRDTMYVLNWQIQMQNDDESVE